MPRPPTLGARVKRMKWRTVGIGDKNFSFNKAPAIFTSRGDRLLIGYEKLASFDVTQCIEPLVSEASKTSEAYLMIKHPVVYPALNAPVADKVMLSKEVHEFALNRRKAFDRDLYINGKSGTTLVPFFSAAYSQAKPSHTTRKKKVF